MRRSFPGRARLGSLRRAVRAGAQQLDPSRFSQRRPAPGTRIGCVCVYRVRHVTDVRRLLARVPCDADVRLWCLDGGPADIPGDLAPITVGHGAGTRFALLNRLIGALPAERPDALVLLDDDVRLVVGDLGALVATGLDAGLDLFQPAHAANSHASWGLVHRQPMTVLRRTALVEQGPVLVLSSRAQEHLLPLPEDLGMGWGSEVRWSRTADLHGLALGVIDAVAVRHLLPGGGAYDKDAAEAVLAEELAAVGLSRLDDLMGVRSSVRVGMSFRRLHRLVGRGDRAVGA